MGSTLKGLSSYRSLSIILQQNDKRYFSKNIFCIEQNNPSLFAIKPFVIGKWILGEILAPWWVNWPGLSLSPFSATLRRGRIFKILLRGLKKLSCKVWWRGVLRNDEEAQRKVTDICQLIAYSNLCLSFYSLLNNILFYLNGCEVLFGKALLFQF